MPILNGVQTYGNWGGPGWSGGRETKGAKLTPDDLKVPGIDPLDELFKAHDLAYEATLNMDPVAKATAILLADLKLMGEMVALGLIVNPLEPDPQIMAKKAGEAAYRDAAMAAFGCRRCLYRQGRGSKGVSIN